ncbi:MAG: ribulose 1,5-bisphosphate carboxylase, partial [Deinococcus sp.]|nr:ribulose 1,5-bisphosphate carboxylase [Deinococcus sp.]
MAGKAQYDPLVFTNAEGIDLDDFIIATYYLETRGDLLKKAEGIAVGQTTGGWV